MPWGSSVQVFHIPNVTQPALLAIIPFGRAHPPTPPARPAAPFDEDWGAERQVTLAPYLSNVAKLPRRHGKTNGVRDRTKIDGASAFLIRPMMSATVVAGN
jgi:hypothetical protein